MDRLLEMMNDDARWQRALARATDKGIRPAVIYQMTRKAVRDHIAGLIASGTYMPSVPHTALIPKDDGTFRSVRICEDEDRIVLSLITEILFEACPSMVHPSCRSYLKGTGCGQTVREIAQQMDRYRDLAVPGWKADLRKYFDSVPLTVIEEAFDRVDATAGPSAVTDMLRRYYRRELYFDENGALIHDFMSLQQGCPVSAFLADVCLYGLDCRLAAMDGTYVRYSDDILFAGPDAEQAMQAMREELASRQLELHPDKVMTLSAGRWFSFLGFSIRGTQVSLSPSRIKKFQRSIREAVARNGRRRCNTVKSVCRLLYGNVPGGHSWATQVLGTVNSEKDINTLNAFVMDCIRASVTGHTSTGGLGYDAAGREGCITRGRGRHVRSNREMTPGIIEGYLTLGCMRRALLTSRDAYESLVASLTV